MNLVQKNREFWLPFFVFVISLTLAGGLIATRKVMAKNTSVAPQAIQSQTPTLKSEFLSKKFDWGSQIYLRLFKKEKQLEVWVEKQKRFELFKTYPICTYGFGDLGPKLKEGDGQAPEGFYFITPSSMNPFSQYHLSVNLGFPNIYDRSHNRTGSALMIHGDCVSVGCFAMTDELIEEIYTLIDSSFQSGQPFIRIHSFPFKMTTEALESYKNSRWYDFWSNLKVGYDWFQQNDYRPPNVTVKNSEYVFSES